MLLTQQELALDYITFSPKMIVVLGRITRLPSNDAPKYSIARILRPNLEEEEGVEAGALEYGAPEGIEQDSDFPMEIGAGEMGHWKVYRL